MIFYIIIVVVWLCGASFSAGVVVARGDIIVDWFDAFFAVGTCLIGWPYLLWRWTRQ